MLNFNSQAGSKPIINEEGVLPLINIVFLLLIFFMLAGQLLTPSMLNIDPAKTSRTASHLRPDPVVHVDAKGQLELHGDAINLADLLTYCQQHQPQKIYIKADQQGRANDVLALAQQLHNNDAQQVLLITESVGK